MKNTLPFLSLIGAGPGDPDLITLKAVNALGNARVVLYDALVNEALLRHCHPEAIIHYVGKRCSQHSYAQEDICQLIVSAAYSHGHVARLKGGDPFVFGRAVEEIEIARKNHIGVEVIPGISSALAVPAMQMIPLTIRGEAQSFWVSTGTTRSGEMSPDIRLAAQSSATVVILMGMQHVQSIMYVFEQLGKTAMPVAVIQNGTLPEQRMVTGTVTDIIDKLRVAEIGSPAVIVIGEVVKYADLLTAPALQQYIHA